MQFNKESLLKQPSPLFLQLRSDLIVMHKEGVCGEEEFLKKHRGTGLHNKTLWVLWNVTRLGYLGYQLSNHEISAEHIRELRNAGFYVTVNALTVSYISFSDLKQQKELIHDVSVFI